MTHVKNISKNRPQKAESLLVTQQKVAVFAAFAAGLGTLGASLNTWLGVSRNLKDTDT